VTGTGRAALLSDELGESEGAAERTRIVLWTYEFKLCLAVLKHLDRALPVLPRLGMHPCRQDGLSEDCDLGGLVRLASVGVEEVEPQPDSILPVEVDQVERRRRG